MFSYESYFELRFGNQGSCCRRPVGSNRFTNKFTKKMVEHPPRWWPGPASVRKEKGPLSF
jgi:hypothetical protein